MYFRWNHHHHHSYGNLLVFFNGGCLQPYQDQKMFWLLPFISDFFLCAAILNFQLCLGWSWRKFGLALAICSQSGLATGQMHSHINHWILNKTCSHSIIKCENIRAKTYYIQNSYHISWLGGLHIPAMPSRKRRKGGAWARHLPPDFQPGYQYPSWVKPIFREPLDDDSGEYSSYSGESESGGCLAINCHVKITPTTQVPA